MVSEKKSKIYDIEKIHEFIDSISLPTERSTSSYRETTRKLRQKKLFDEPIPTEKKTASADLELATSERIIPQGGVSRKEEVQKKEEKAVTATSAAPKVPFFEEASTIEKIHEEELYPHDQPKQESEGSAPRKEAAPPVTVPESSKQNLPAWETVTPDISGKETTDHDKNEEAFLPEFEPVPAVKTTGPQDDDWLSSYEPLEIEITWNKNQVREETTQGVSKPASFEDVTPPESTSVTEVPAPESISHFPKEDKQEQKHLRKELKQKIKLERQALKKQEQEDRRHKRLEERERKEQFLLPQKEKKGLQGKISVEKQVRREARKREYQRKKQAKLCKKNELLATGLRENAYRRKEKEKRREKRSKEREKMQGYATIIGRKAPAPSVQHSHAPVTEPQGNEAEQRVARETEERRTLKELEHELQKERERKEKEARRVKAAEEENAKKIMEARFQEERLRDQQASADKRVDVFQGFDSMDPMTALLLYNNGYTSVERLLTATLDDLMRIGIKKKIAHQILAETKEFVEWKVLDAEELPESTSSSANET